MEMTLNLTFEDGAKVAEAMKKIALESGWDEDELVESGVLVEYARVVDAALSALGITALINPNPSTTNNPVSDEDDFDFDFDFDDLEDCDYEDEDEDDTCQYSLTVKGEFALRYMEAGHTFEEACEIADLLFGEDE